MEIILKIEDGEISTLGNRAYYLMQGTLTADDLSQIEVIGHVDLTHWVEYEVTEIVNMQFVKNEPKTAFTQLFLQSVWHNLED